MQTVVVVEGRREGGGGGGREEGKAECMARWCWGWFRLFWLLVLARKDKCVVVEKVPTHS
jgi:hypothetical protein